jgi:serine/threonine-protein phosphatase Stp1
VKPSRPHDPVPATAQSWRCAGLKIASAARTHAGCVRILNEDAVLERSDIGLWAVSDGMGGHLAGDIASALVVDTLERMPRPKGEISLAGSVHGALVRANDRLYRRGAAYGENSTMGATVAVLGIEEGRYFCLWAGDSRLYRFRGGRLTQLTRDHRYVQELLDSGTLDERSAKAHALRNVLTRAVGTDPEIRLDRRDGAIAPGDIFLLTTDGVTTVCEDQQITEILSAGGRDRAADEILACGLRCGAPDNLSLVLVEVQAN